jgi:hypothetical protein
MDENAHGNSGNLCLRTVSQDAPALALQPAADALSMAILVDGGGKA